MKLRDILFITIVLFAVLILYHPVLSTYFSHDDFFHFIVSNPNAKPGGYLYFLGFHPFAQRGIAFYRPVFREFLYGPFYQLFGLSPLPFRVFSFLIHFANIHLLYQLLQKFTKNSKIAFFASFFFAISASNVSSLYYLAGGIQVMGASMFVLITLVLFDKYLDRKKNKYFALSFLAFLLALASHEQAVLIPVLLAGIALIRQKTNKIKLLYTAIFPFILTTAIFVFLNYKLIGYSSGEGQYQLNLSIKKLTNSLAWYFGWALGLPEMLIDFVPPGLKLDPRLMRYWGAYFKIIFPAFFVSIGLVTLSTFYLLKTKIQFLLDKKLWFFIVWFFLGLLPVIFLPSHKSGHYLYISLPAFWSALAFVGVNAYEHALKTKPRIAGFLMGALLIALATLSATSAMLGKNTYWAAARGRLAEKLLESVKGKYPTLPKGASIYFTNNPDYPYVSEDWGGTSKQAYYTLNGQDALQLLYNDPSLRVYYEDLSTPYSPENNIFQLEAIIP